MRPARLILSLVVSFVLAIALPSAPASATSCVFVQGFATLHEQLPDIVGSCLDNEGHLANGDGLQITTHGLLYWRKADNVTAFTDGFRTWINGPAGLNERLNSERFCWEPDATSACLATEASFCRAGDPLANVWGPDRLTVLQDCLTVTGLVDRVIHEDDGDIHVDLQLDVNEDRFLDQANLSRAFGDLITEIVPADQPGCVLGQPPRPPFDGMSVGVCTGADIPTPVVGTRVSVTGPYVLDRNHGWREIHPVWGIRVLATG